MICRTTQPNPIETLHQDPGYLALIDSLVKLQVSCCLPSIIITEGKANVRMAWISAEAGRLYERGRQIRREMYIRMLRVIYAMLK